MHDVRFLAPDEPVELPAHRCELRRLRLLRKMDMPHAMPCEKGFVFAACARDKYVMPRIGLAAREIDYHVHDAIADFLHMIGKVENFHWSAGLVTFNLEFHCFTFPLVGLLWPLRSATVNRT
jgi:hypothetical protein